MAKEKATSRAAWAMSLAGSILVIFTPEFGRDTSWAVKLIATVIGAIGSYTVFEIGRRLLMRFYYRRLLGKWYYVSRPQTALRFRSENYAVMQFKLDDNGDLFYEVTLYPTARGMIEPGSELPSGHAHSLALGYDVPKGCIDLVFSLDFTQRARAEDEPRKGRLFLRLRENDSLLQGNFISDIWGRDKGEPELSSGTVTAVRDPKLLGLPAAAEPPAPLSASPGSAAQA